MLKQKLDFIMKLSATVCILFSNSTTMYNQQPSPVVRHGRLNE
nr:MAG TPA: hypothetical protein [Caudoviricetes sp.]